MLRLRAILSCLFVLFGDDRWIIRSKFFLHLSSLFGQVKSRGYFDECEEGTEVYEERCV